MSLNDENNNGGDGWKSLWTPVFFALLFFGVAFLLAWSETRSAQKQIETNVNKSIDLQTQTQPVNVPKYDSSAQAAINDIEARRKKAHALVDHLRDRELQNVLDTLFNKE